jgi:hypothetical protein
VRVLFGLGFDVLFWRRSVNAISLLGMRISTSLAIYSAAKGFSENI